MAATIRVWQPCIAIQIETWTFSHWLYPLWCRVVRIKIWNISPHKKSSLSSKATSWLLQIQIFPLTSHLARLGFRMAPLLVHGPLVMMLSARFSVEMQLWKRERERDIDRNLKSVQSHDAWCGRRCFSKPPFWRLDDVSFKTPFNCWSYLQKEERKKTLFIVLFWGCDLQPGLLN